jgi:hypothetical protein
MAWLLVVLVVCAGVAGGVFWYRRGHDATQERAPAQSVSDVVRHSGARVAQAVKSSGAAVSEAVSASRARVSETVKTSGARVSGAVRSSKTNISGLVRSVRRRVLAHRRQADLAPRFRDWVLEARLSDRKQLYQNMPQTARAFSDWLASLPPEQLEVFFGRISEALSGWDIDLNWLVGRELARVPALQRAIEESVLSYCLAHWRATQAQDDIRTFTTFQAWQRDPYSERQKEFNQRLYSRLVAKGLLTAPDPEMLLASEDRRQDYVVQALRQVSEADAIAFSSALYEIAAVEPAAVPEPPVEQSPPQKKRAGGRTSRGVLSATTDESSSQTP